MPNDELTAKEMCSCWCQMAIQPEYNSYRDYFETHAHGLDCIPCMEYVEKDRLDELNPPTT